MTTNLVEFDHQLLRLPDYLKQWPSWAAWSAPVKRPLDIRRALAPASTTQPDSWCSYPLALTHLRRIAPPVPYLCPVPLGVGILVAPPLVFVDFDDLIDSRGNAPEWAVDFISRAIQLGAFVERSSSGEGAHVFLRASPALALRRNRYTRAHPSSSPVGIEIYTHTRFAALTGIPFSPSASPRPDLNDPAAGDDLLRDFIAALETHGAPIITPNLPPAPTSLPEPTLQVLELAAGAITPTLQHAFSAPAAAYQQWATRRAAGSTDSSLSSWRFSLFMEAARASPVSPLPVYELFNPTTPDPLHPGIPEWAEFSGQLKKRHRRYADIQRAHAIVQEELRQLALDLGEAPQAEQLPGTPPPLIPPPETVPVEPDPSWAQLGLVMHTGSRGTKPLPTSVNFLRILQRHPYFSKFRIERNAMDGVTTLNRLPMPDTQVTRWQEPLRAILGMTTDPSAVEVRAAVEVIADDNPFDPLLEYLNALPRFVPPPDYSHAHSLLSCWLEKTGAAPSHDLKKFSRRILLGLVARALKPGVKFDYVPVFEGPQGVGKSTLIKEIVSPDFYATLFGGLQSKDAIMTLKGKWAVELSELVALKKTDNESLKAFFATDTDTYRPPYGRAILNIKRRTILIGTVNDSQYLTDHTGARRYWPIYFPGAIDIQWFRANRDALFAEAIYFFDQGERFHDTLEEIASEGRQRALAQRQVTPAWQMKLFNHLRALPKPHLPSADLTGSSGCLSPSYIADLQTILDLPNAVQHMGASQLAFFLKRAGYVKMSLSYRPVHDTAPTKLNTWAHPALARLSAEELRAFLSHFPNLFHYGVPPGSWVLLQTTHLGSALSTLAEAPVPLPLMDSDSENE